jgi:FKBP-type peptidyl-prolyl cis-trans isomerase
MVRYIFAVMAAFVLASCQPALKIDQADPWKSLYPWKHNWKEVQKLPSGVEYVVIRKGDGKGAFPSPADKVEVNYDGRFAKSGEKFDSSYDSGESVTFPLNGVIPGWTDGLQKMQPGDMVMFWIPWNMAYGEEGRGPIPGKADLMFQVELVNVIAAVTADLAAWNKVTPWPTDSSDVVRKSSGLEYLIVQSGDPNGASPGEGDYVRLHVEGRKDDEDKSVVLSTYEDQEPVLFPVSDLTPGWSELVKLMRPGDHWMVKMPPHLMYGAEGDGRVGPNETVIYEVRIVETIIPPKATDPVVADPAPATPPT